MKKFTCACSPNDPIVEGCDANHTPVGQCGEGHTMIISFDLYHASSVPNPRQTWTAPGLSLVLKADVQLHINGNEEGYMCLES